MQTDYLNFLEQNSSKNESTSEESLSNNGYVNLTLRADAECQVTCDGDFFVLLTPNQIVKEKAPVGQHILQFISVTHPEVQIEKIVDFPDAGKNYLVLVNEFAGLMKDIVNREKEEDVKRIKEQARLEAELAEAEAERRYAEEQARMYAKEREQKEQRIQQLNSINFVEKYLKKVWIEEAYQDWDEKHPLTILAFEKDGLFFDNSVFESALLNQFNMWYNIKDEYDIISIQHAIENEILPAINQGNDYAMFVYAIIQTKGSTAPVVWNEHKDAFKYLKLASEKNNPYALYCLAVLFYKLSHRDKWALRNELCPEVEDCSKHSWLLYERASLHHMSYAYYYLSQEYYWHKNNDSEALKLCRKSAELGDLSGQLMLAIWLSNSREEDSLYSFRNEKLRPETCVTDDVEALRLYKAVAQKCGNSTALDFILKCTPNRMKWDVLMVGVTNGLVDPVSRGHDYYNAQQYEIAVKLYSFSADTGNAQAQNSLANCYYCGYGVQQDYVEAIRLYKLSVGQGNRLAQSNLANCYYAGVGVTQDYNEAVRLYRMSAEQNNAWAQYRLGVCYYEGYGCCVDYDEAKKWLVLALGNGEQRAQEYLDKLP